MNGSMSAKAMHHSLSFSRIVSGLALLVLLVTSTQPVAAHGQGQTLELAQAPVGPYYLSVWSAPAILRPGEIHLAAVVTDEAGQPVPDCDVSLEIVPLTREQKPITVMAQPLTDGKDYRHEAQLNLPTIGSYQVVVTVRDPAGLGDEARFNIEITAVPPGTKILLYISIGLTVVVALELLKRGLILFKLWQPTAVTHRASP